MVENLIGSNHVLDVKFVRINDIIEKQNKGKLLFSISDGSFPDQKLSAVHVAYKDANQYTWSGSNFDGSFTATFIKDKNGFAGSIYHYELNELYRIFPINTSISALIKMDNKHNGVSCGISPEGPSSEAPSTPEILSTAIDCDTECAGHIDILFLLRPDMQEWMIHQNFTVTYLNVLIAELNLAFTNSGIRHTIDYSWVDFDWVWDGADDSDICEEEVIALSQSSEAQALRNQYNADVVVMLRADDPWIEGTSLGCTTQDAIDLNPSGDGAYTIMEAQTTLKQSIFPHEIGHIFGPRHGYQTASNTWDDMLCSYAHTLLFLEEDDNGNSFIERVERTIMNGNPEGILHFSDPERNFKSVPTGKPVTYTNGGILVPAFNNAAQIRGSGCIVSSFNDSPNINGVISVSEGDCLLNLNANIQPLNADYEYNWFWSFDGLFTNEYPGIPLGTGADISVLEPDVDQCDSYFVQMVIHLDGEIVLTEQILQPGGICTENIQACSEDQAEAKGSLNQLQISINIDATPTILNDSRIYKTSYIGVHPNPTSNTVGISSDGAKIKSLSIYNLSGQSVFDQKYNTHSVELGISFLAPGIYFLLINNRYFEKLVIDSGF